jgi:hypothetical protein
MIRPLALAAVLALVAGPAAAQQAPPAIRLTVEPMAEPVPALKYPLLPPLRELKSGNALLLYYRAFSPEWQVHRRNPWFLDRVGDFNDKPLREVTSAEIDTLVSGFAPALLREVDRGARRSYCDWEMNDRVKEDGIGLMLPDVQGFRQVATLLKLRARQELLAGRYDQAARTLQTGLKLSRDVAKGPTLIQTLVGVACALTMLSVVDDWVDRPGAPNLYWALTDLPRPLVSLRNGMEGERLFIDWLFPGYRELLTDPNAPLSPARVRTSLDKYIGLLDLEHSQRTWVPLMTALKTYPRAKRFLRQQGRSAADIEAMPALQVVFLYEIHRYDVTFDNLRKWTSLPYHEAAPRVLRALEKAKARMDQEHHSSIEWLLLPAPTKVIQTAGRVDRKVAALRCVEAVRLYAAAHGGKWPARLEDITEVPIPLDPFTGKAFDYRVEENWATLTGPPPAGEKADIRTTIRYELTMRTTKGK